MYNFKLLILISISHVWFKITILVAGISTIRITIFFILAFPIKIFKNFYFRVINPWDVTESSYHVTIRNKLCYVQRDKTRYSVVSTNELSCTDRSRMIIVQHSSPSVHCTVIRGGSRTSFWGLDN